MEAIIQVTLKRPWKLRVIDIPLVQRRVISMNAQAGILHFDYQFYGTILLARRELHERVLIPAELGIDLGQRGSTLGRGVLRGTGSARLVHAFMLA